MSKLTIGTYKDFVYSIRITKANNVSNFVADVYVADTEGDVRYSFVEYGSTDWALRNACIKRIITEMEA